MGWTRAGEQKIATHEKVGCSRRVVKTLPCLAADAGFVLLVYWLASPWGETMEPQRRVEKKHVAQFQQNPILAPALCIRRLARASGGLFWVERFARADRES
jgi:hypothetical protein